MGKDCIVYLEIQCWFHLYNKSTQRVYNTFEKGQTLPPSPHSPRSPLILFFFDNFRSFSLRKKKEFCLVLSHLALESTPFQFTPYPLSLSSFHHPSPFRPFPMYSLHLAGIFVSSFCDSERTSRVPCKCRHKRNEASHLTPFEWAVDKTLIQNITLQLKYQSDSFDMWYVENIW